VLACAGSGLRMGGGDKLLLDLGGSPVLAWSLRAIDGCEAVDSITIVASERNLDGIAALLAGMETRLPVELILGGARRQDSIRIAVAHLSRAAPDVVLVHDGARPLVSPSLLAAAIDAARQGGAVTAAIPLKDSIKKVGADGLVRRSLDRAELVAVQTPQAFTFDVLERAHREGLEQGVVVDDDAELVELIGLPVRVIPGDPRNLKITTPEDAIVAAAYLADAP
jgi:2-C-methyl-D-erythritol 4-phosphate cytidylyltransferase